MFLAEFGQPKDYTWHTKGQTWPKKNSDHVNNQNYMDYFQKTFKFDLKKSLLETFQLFFMDCDSTLAIRFWYGYTASIFVIFTHIQST